MYLDVCSFQLYYVLGKLWLKIYCEWVDVMMVEVWVDKCVCVVFYGYFGVFVWLLYKVVDVVWVEGFIVFMEFGIFVEDCFYVDFGIDLGWFGCQYLEVSQFLFYYCMIDLCGYLILWQVGLVGDFLFKCFSIGLVYCQVLVD